MRAVIQRVSSARVIIDEKEYSRIGNGLLVLLGVEKEDTNEDAGMLARRIVDQKRSWLIHLQSGGAADVK